MKVLVTGGSGYLGTHVRRSFGADDLSRRSGSDILNPDDLSSVGEYDVVIHLAADLDKRPQSADDVFGTNVGGTVNVLKNIREDAVFIFASTRDVYGRFADNYDQVPETCPTMYSGQSALEWSKLIAEHYVDFYSHTANFRSCIFRLSSPYARASDENTPNFVGAYADSINNGEKIRLPAGGLPRRDLLHVDDISKACSAFIGSELRHGTYNLGGGRANSLTLRDLIRKLEKVSGLQAQIDEEHPLPNPMQMNYVSDISRIRQELGWQPEIGLDEGLKTLF